MRLLLDTHAFFWWLKGDRRLSTRAGVAIDNADNDILVSAVVAWEMASKSRIGKWPEGRIVVDDIEGVVAAKGLEPLPVSLAHARRAGLLDGEHRDPFDRLLAAQAEIEGATLVTADSVFRTFGVSVLW
jgi:PIN domain nuclease of toxin-antitoxin system